MKFKIDKYCAFVCILAVILTSYPIFSSSGMYVEEPISSKIVLCLINILSVVSSFFAFEMMFESKRIAITGALLWSFSCARIVTLLWSKELRNSVFLTLLPLVLMLIFLLIKKFRIYLLVCLAVIMGVCVIVWRPILIDPPGILSQQLLRQFCSFPSDYSEDGFGMSVGIILYLATIFFVVTCFIGDSVSKNKQYLLGKILILPIIILTVGTLLVSATAYIGILTALLVFQFCCALMYIEGHKPKLSYIGYCLAALQIVSSGVFLLESIVYM